jgi:hypothetical protein
VTIMPPDTHSRRLWSRSPTSRPRGRGWPSRPDFSRS